MAEYKLTISEQRPYFAELPYYLWGQINYDSDGDCETPVDRNWSWIEMTNRETDEHLEISSNDTEFTVSGPDPAAARITHFLIHRCSAKSDSNDPTSNIGDWNHDKANDRTQRVAAEFENELLIPFADGKWFWGSWKWIGWFGTDFTWVGRWIMDSVVRNDDRAVNFCVDWLRDGPVGEPQSAALRYALTHLTSANFSTDKEWIEWYDGSGKAKFPEPNVNEWYEELKTIHEIE